MRARSLLFAALAAAACGFLPGGASAQGNPDFRLNNRLSQPIMEVYVSSSGQAAWGQDLMGSNVLPPGGVLTLNGPAGQCDNDIKLVLADGSVLERLQLNTCSLTDVNVTP